MESRTRSASPSFADGKLQTSSSPNKISAYYSLVFPHSTFYIQTLSVTIGRRCYPNPNAPNSSSSANPEPVQVDVDLGALKSVSRLHAKIEYDQEEDRFVLVVIGRNGAWVDGVWQGSGTKATLGERSQIQIASRTFHFVLPPPPPPDDTPSPSSNSSTNRPRSPSLDITSISPPSSQPSHSPPPKQLKPPTPPPEPQLGNSNLIARSTKANAKKRKKSDISDIPVPPSFLAKQEELPPKPTLTYAQLIYRAIKAYDNKATLQEICAWIAKEYEYYRYNDGTAWMSSVRHNLSSSRAFKKLERCGGDRGKGFFWSLDEAHQHLLDDQPATGTSESGTKARKKDKASEPALKRSVKGDPKSVPPPPLTSTPLSAAASSSTSNIPVTSGQAYPPQSVSNPYTVLTQAWNTRPTNNALPSSTPTMTTFNIPTAPTPLTLTSHASVPPVTSTSSLVTIPALAPPPTAASVSAPTTSTPATKIPAPDIAIPIILGPIPPTHPSYSPTHPSNSVKEGFIILHERKLILDPDVFSSLTKDMLVELEKMGASKAIEVLTSHMVRVLKERRKIKKNANKSAKGKGVKGASGSGKKTASGSAPATGSTISAMIVDPMVPIAITQAPSNEAESPIIIVDSDDDGPVLKKRKIEHACFL
ncbi:hypothetical protein BDP27DRAFT_799814 [Rhodocollybia butyracea]|uniref:Uncharacterized protein n=1 Tax=Rhodocollybia butyracea TaxID=206335 RepID=A0A9P5Q911_9AGAR|nr:hypothetical protein BDP27DRAFT_799814 [Rhodocollybia butyracea]